MDIPHQQCILSCRTIRAHPANGTETCNIEHKHTVKDSYSHTVSEGQNTKYIAGVWLCTKSNAAIFEHHAMQLYLHLMFQKNSVDFIVVKPKVKVNKSSHDSCRSHVQVDVEKKLHRTSLVDASQLGVYPGNEAVHLPL